MPRFYASWLFLLMDPATTGISTLSLHDALPIFPAGRAGGRSAPIVRSAAGRRVAAAARACRRPRAGGGRDRKSTRLNSSHVSISYAVFCLKKKTHSALSTRSQRVGEL